MANAIRSIGHEDKLSLVGHLSELRARLIVALAALAVAFGVCFWQNHALLGLLNRPLAHQAQRQVRDGRGPLGATYAVARSSRDVALQLRAVVGLLRAPNQRQAPTARASLDRVDAGLERDISLLSAAPQGDRPVTLGIGEPFTTTVTVSLVFALILALPVLLFELYGFLAPALDPVQRRTARPLMFAVPALFAAGALFGYLVVLPAAVRFFQNFNSAQFNVLVQASPYYKFAAITLLGMGLLFQIPVGIVAVTRAGLITPGQLRRNRRYAIAACGVIAALLPGDAITLVLETVPPYLLFELSLLVATIVQRRSRARAPANRKNARAGGAARRPRLPRPVSGRGRAF
jgi:sec-independent protein translocase protein TatC